MMALAPQAAAVHTCAFPVLSFLHVPGKMKEPLWLMMGTAFLVKLCGEAAAASRHQYTLLTAQHTFVPWKYVGDPSQLKIPNDFRRPRFVVGRVYLPDATTGRAVPHCYADLQLLSLHETQDLALVAVRNEGAPIGGKGGTVKEVPVALSERLSAASPVAIADKDVLQGERVTVEGFRGVGRLGEEDTMDPAAVHKLSKHDQEQLIREMQSIEGKQEAAIAKLEVLDSLGMGALIGGRCLHGMSGSPLLTSAGTCAGVLYGKHPDAPQHIGYSPASEIHKWLRTVAASRLETPTADL